MSQRDKTEGPHWKGLKAVPVNVPFIMLGQNSGQRSLTAAHWGSELGTDGWAVIGMAAAPRTL